MNILSIQSHVAYGYVGNRAATFPLQRLGHDVWAVNTVQFSNHTGYGDWTGQVFGAEHIREIVDGIAARDALSSCDGVLSGYMGAAALGETVLDAVARVKAANGRALYLCDPVMGDVGRGFFVAEGIPEFMRERAVPAADIVTPNRFELEYLANTQVATLDDAITAARGLTGRGPRLVLVTSLERADTPAGKIEMLLVSPEAAWLVATPKYALEPAPNGSGDATAALFLGFYLKEQDPVAALAETAAAVHEIFAATKQAGTRELALIQAQDRIAAPVHHFAVEKVG